MSYFQKIKLGLHFAKMLQQHGGAVLHGGDIDLLTKDLGDALRRQKKVMQDTDLGALETAYERAPVWAEVKVLTLAVSKKLDLDTTGKSAEDVLQEIVKKTEARKSDAAAEIKGFVDWQSKLCARPEVEKILDADRIKIEAPESWTDIRGVGKIFTHGAQRLVQELSIKNDYLKEAKKVPEQKAPAKKRQHKSQKE